MIRACQGAGCQSGAATRAMRKALTRLCRGDPAHPCFDHPQDALIAAARQRVAMPSRNREDRRIRCQQIVPAHPPARVKPRLFFGHEQEHLTRIGGKW